MERGIYSRGRFGVVALRDRQHGSRREDGHRRRAPARRGPAGGAVDGLTGACPIVIPVWNEEAVIGEPPRASSIATSVGRLGAVEIVVVDDASTDGHRRSSPSCRGARRACASLTPTANAGHGPSVLEGCASRGATGSSSSTPTASSSSPTSGRSGSAGDDGRSRARGAASTRRTRCTGSCSRASSRTVVSLLAGRPPPRPERPVPALPPSRSGTTWPAHRGRRARAVDPRRARRRPCAAGASSRCPSRTGRDAGRLEPARAGGSSRSALAGSSSSCASACALRRAPRAQARLSAARVTATAPACRAAACPAARAALVGACDAERLAFGVVAVLALVLRLVDLGDQPAAPRRERARVVLVAARRPGRATSTTRLPRAGAVLLHRARVRSSGVGDFGVRLAPALVGHGDRVLPFFLRRQLG